MPAPSRVEPVDPAITIEVRREPLLPNPEQATRIDQAWQALCAHNPRYFNGRILSFESYDPRTARVVARDVEYRLHAVRETVDSGIAFFGVTGLLRVRQSGTDRYLVGKRGASVHEYPDQWEFAPCGGIDPPADGRDHLSTGDIAQELWREGSEELGLDVSGTAPVPVALVHDDPVGSTDLMMLVDLGSAPAGAKAANWEYQATRWLTLDEIDALHASEETVIPTTLAMASHLRTWGC